MFDLNDKNRIMELIDGRKCDSYIEPLYIKMYNDKYGLDEIKDIHDFNPSAFKVGFGSSNGLFVKKAFQPTMATALDVITVFNMYKEDLQCSRNYYVFEMGYFVNTNPSSNQYIDELYSQIEYYYEMLYNYLETHTKELKKQWLQNLIEESSS